MPQKFSNPFPKHTIIPALVKWFHQNYEAIEENTPRDDGEWVFIWGEPEATSVLLDEAFGDIFCEELLDRVAERIEHTTGNNVWVPVPDPGEDEEPMDEIDAEADT